MTYNANGRISTTEVNGLTYTGRYASNGSWNIVLNASASPVGLYHPCGALNAVSVADGSPYYHANGSVNVFDTGGAVYVLTLPKP